MKIGVDEAGRGPAIGPLVVCAFGSISTSNLIELGVKDSKELTRKRREESVSYTHLTLPTNREV